MYSHFVGKITHVDYGIIDAFSCSKQYASKLFLSVDCESANGEKHNEVFDGGAINELLIQAKVKRISQLVGKPVKATVQYPGVSFGFHIEEGQD